MMITKTRLGALTMGAIWMLASGLPAVADDTELFVATSANAGIRPNVLFIIDNSGSMASEVRTQEDYDPGTLYSGGCDANRVYWRTGTGDEPDCTTDRWFEMTALKCGAALEAFRTGGQFIDVMAQYDPDTIRGRRGDVGERWEDIDQNQHTRAVECKTDAGSHGEDEADPDLYARDGSTSPTGYWGDVTTRISWTSSHNNTTYSIYAGNYLNWISSPTTTQTRLEIVQDVATSLLGSINGVDVGLMYFNAPDQGGLVAHAMENVATARSTIQAKINALRPETFTPLSETLYEAAQYFRGDEVVFGDPDSVAESRDPADTDLYNSPINNTCQQNYIVLLTDGEPTRDRDATSAIQAMTDDAGDTFASLVGGTCDAETYPAGFNPDGGQCLDDLAQFLHDGDHSPLADQQSINTYTIGFEIDLPILEQTAQRGGGVYYTADDTASLANALTNILIDVLQTNQTFTSPSVAVNAFNRTQNLSDLFISVFSPTGQRHWHGNLKKYQLRPSDATIVDANGDPAVDPSTGFFSEYAQSFWSASVDGEVVTSGGAANLIPTPTNRKVYTYFANVNLTDATNRISPLNTANLTDTELDTGGAGDPTAAEVISFINGVDLADWTATTALPTRAIRWATLTLPARLRRLWPERSAARRDRCSLPPTTACSMPSTSRPASSSGLSFRASSWPINAATQGRSLR